MGKASELQREINHAALEYLNQWFRTDRHHMRETSEPITGEALRKLAAKYMVSRGFSMKDAKGRTISEQEQALRWDQAAGFVRKARGLAKGDAAVVLKLATQLGQIDTRAFDLTSAATKFLWFAGRHDVRILDVRAVNALRKLDTPVRGTKLNYGWFEQAWARQAHACSNELQRAAENLPTQFPWSAIPASSQGTALKEAIGQEWFKDRIFDKYLWTKGQGAKPLAAAA